MLLQSSWFTVNSNAIRKFHLHTPLLNFVKYQNQQNFKPCQALFLNFDNLFSKSDLQIQNLFQLVHFWVTIYET